MCGAVCSSVFQCVPVHCAPTYTCAHGQFSHDVCCSVLQCAAMCCSVLQCCAVLCSVLHTNRYSAHRRFPHDVAHFKKAARKLNQDTGEACYFILKPDNGSKGQGIRLAEHGRVLKTWAQMSFGVQQVDILLLAVCCSLLQSVAVCCSMLQCGASLRYGYKCLLASSRWTLLCLQ